jgi:nucleoporin NUP42
MHSYNVDKEIIRSDLTKERPQWIFSAYGPGKAAPAQLFGGSIREQSFEEMRLHHYIAAAAGNAQHAVF